MKKHDPRLRQLPLKSETVITGTSWWMHVAPDESMTAAARREQTRMSTGPAANKVSATNYVGLSPE